MEALNTRCVRPMPRRMLSSEVAPTAIAPSGPSSTTAASVAAELGDQADRLEVRVVWVESQTRNSSASTARVVPDLLTAPSVSASVPSACTAVTTVAATTAAIYRQAVGESRDGGSPLAGCPLPVTMPVRSPPGDDRARWRRASLRYGIRRSSRDLSE